MEKGYTLVELLAVIVIIAIIASISTVNIIKTIQNAKKDSFKDSVFAAIESYKNMESDNDFSDIGDINVEDLDLDHNYFTDGIIRRSENGIIAVNVTNGSYCANGRKDQLVIEEGNCN